MKCFQRTLFALFALTVVTDALQLAKDVSIEDSKETGGNRTKPRMLVSEGCDGWRAVIRHAHFILKSHGISTPWQRLYTLHGNEQANVTEGDPTQATKRAKKAWTKDTKNEDAADELPEDPAADDDEKTDNQAEASVDALVQTRNSTKGYPEQDIAAMINTSKSFAAENKSLVFRGSIKDLGNAKSIMDLSLITRLTRQNKLDQLVCRIKDCYDNKNLGYPVVNGKKSEKCWRHRKEEVEGYKAFVKPSMLVQNIEELENATNNTYKDLAHMGFSGPSLVPLRTEDLLDFEYDKEAVSRANSAWSTLLKAWGVSPNGTELMSYLNHHSAQRARPLPHTELIDNYAEVKTVIESHKRLQWMLRE